MSWIDFANLPAREPYEQHADYHATISVQLCELINAGFVDFNDKSWRWNAYNEEQRARLCDKITNRFYYREIGILPPGKWKKEFLRILNEIQPKYNVLYDAIDSGSNVLAISDSYGKSRNIYSDYPATQLSGNDDYASNGNDSQREDIVEGDFIAKAKEIQREYDDIDVMMLDDLEALFTCLFSTNVNGF